MNQSEGDDRRASEEPRSSARVSFKVWWERFKSWWEAQIATTRGDVQRLRSWWKERTKPVEEPIHPSSTVASPEVEAGWFGSTARIAMWAPTAVFLALLEAIFTTAILFGVLSLFRDYSVTANRAITGITTLLAFGLLMFWFASAPNAPTTTRRFWTLFQVGMVVLGVVGLVIAILVTLEQIEVLEKLPLVNWIDISLRSPN